MLDWTEVINWYKLEAARSGQNPRLQVIAVLSVIYFLSKLLLYYPLEMSHKARKLSKALQGSIIAHRGSISEGLPENTVAAFKDAVAAGADIVEFDVWLTKDNKVVVHHDSTLTRMTQGACVERICELEYASLPKIVPGVGQRERIPSCTSSASEWQRIPLLDEVLAVIPEHVGVIIEFKQDSNELIDSVHSLITKLGDGRKQNMFWFSLTEKINAKLRAKDESIPTIVSTTRVLLTLLMYYVGVLPFVSFPDAVFGITLEQITLERIQTEKSIKDFPGWFKRLLYYILQGKPSGIMLAPTMFTHLRRRGIPVWFLGCQNEEDLKISIKSGATAVLTDRVNWLSSFIRQRGIRFQAMNDPPAVVK
jgi:glycerophosphoryl diester phosphodiesterase